MARLSYNRINPIDCLKNLREKVLGPDISSLAMGSMLFNQDGVIVTDDIKEEYIPENNPPIVVETQYAQELSWLMAVLLEAAVLTVESLEYKNQAIKDEVLACVGSLSDVAEKI